MEFILEAACHSNIGKRRYNNEDNFFFDGTCMEEDNRGTHNPLLMDQPLKQGLCLAVFDGMGGENYGEKASFAAARQMMVYDQKSKDFYISEKTYLQKMVTQLNAAVVSRAQELLTSRMGTTIAALYFTPRNVYCCNVGDSRVFRLRSDVFTQLSEDHISQRPMGTGRKAPLTQHLGMDPQEVLVVPHISKGELLSGDYYLICSDGLTDMVDNAAIMDIILKNVDIYDATLELVNAAMEKGGKDNITVILCHIR